MIRNFFLVDHKLFYLILVSLFFHLIAAYFSVGFYEQDEHFSILEPIISKLGENATLGWDFYINYIKQWFLSFIFLYLIKFLNIMGIESPFQWIFFIRIFSSILGWLSVISLIHLAKKQLDNEKYLNVFIFISTLFWFYPYFHARPASENISISFLIISITLFTYFRTNKRILLLCGIIFGLSIVTRYTNILIIGFFGIWAILFNKLNFKESVILTIGFSISFFISILIDYWGYQKNTFVILNYFQLNYHWSQIGYFSSSNTNMWWYNFYFIFKEFLPPISILLIISILGFWIRFPKNIITWMTLPYFIFLCITPHKETRFLFPILVFAPLFFVVTYQSLIFNGRNITNILLSYKVVKLILYFLIFINIIVLCLLSITPANNLTHAYKFLYENKYNIKNIYTLDKIPYRKSDLLINFYRNKEITFTKITTLKKCKEIELENKIIFDDYNGINKFFEIQKFSIPNWTYEYYINCNKNDFEKNFKLTKQKKYYMFHKLEYYDFFNNIQKNNCNIIYYTFPKWLFKINFKNWMGNLSAWYIFECSD